VAGPAEEQFSAAASASCPWLRVSLNE